MLSWMRREADRHDLEAEDRRGGIIIDEMSIQVIYYGNQKTNICCKVKLTL